MRKIKRVLRKILRLPARILRRFDRKIHRGFTKFFRGLYKVKALRPLAKKIYPFFHYHHRIAATGLCFLFILGIGIPAVQPYLRSQRYKLNAQTKELLGEADKDLTSKLTFDDKNQIFQFNKGAKEEPATKGNPMASLKSQVGGASEKDEQLYSVDVSKDLSKGITYYDNQMQLSFKLTPQFSTMPGEQREGHLIYPLNGAKGQVAYTVDAGGMKENAVLYKSPGNTFDMEYKLGLPKSLEAKLIPETGEVGIYSADPALFGSISYGSSDDQAKVQSARENSEKTYLTFKIPAPVVLGVGNTDQKSVAAVESHFELSGDTLRVVTRGLDKAQYPLSIDPSVSVDSNSDFQTGNMEDNNFSISGGSLNRGKLTGGSVGSYSSATLPYNLVLHSTVAYNGYIYVTGGWNGSQTIANVRYATLNASTGAIGSWSSGTSFSTAGARGGHASFVYNGYLYIAGGWSSGTNVLNDVWFAPIDASTGNVGAWSQTTSFSTGRTFHSSVVYNGYMYVMGGDKMTTVSNHTTNCSGSAVQYCSDVQYAPINANGTISSGAWKTSTSSLPYQVSGMKSVAYNGYLYRIGGDWTTDVQYAPIKSDGDIGSWVSTTSLTSVRYDGGVAVSNGYIYLAGGSGNGGSGGSYGLFSSVQYAPINADGSLGAWLDTTALSSVRTQNQTVIYNGYLYILGGTDNSTNTSNISYAAINPPGVTAGYGTANNFGTGRERHATVAYNGYLYVIGGRKGAASTACRNSASNTLCNETRYASINTNGTVGTWNTATYFANARYGHAAVAYNGYLYILGGDTGSRTNNVQRATINLSNGSLGSWTNMTSFATARYLHTAEVYNGYMYVIGGDTSGATTNVQFTAIDASGNLTGWNNTTVLPAARSYHASTVYAGYLYVAGGNTGTYLNTVYYAPLNSDGSISPGAWQTTATLNTPRDSFGLTASNGYLYASGGTTTGGSQITSVEYAPIKSDGSLDSWQTTTAMPAARSSLGTVAYNGYLYQVGGFGAGYNNTVYYAQITNGGAGTTGSWGSAGTGFTQIREELASVAYNGYLYVSGGYKGSTASTTCRSVAVGSGVTCNDVQYAPLNSNGTIGTWQNAEYFPTPRSGHRMIAYNGYLYVLGGADNGGAAINDTRVAKIKSDGSLEPWSSTDGFTTARYYFGATAYNGYMYIMGGEKSTSDTGCRNVPAGYLCRDIQYASIDSSTGALSNWQNTGYFSDEYRMVGTVAHNGYLYRIGGGYFGGTVITTEYAPINSGNGSVGSWSPTTSLIAPRSMGEPVIANGYVYVLGGGDVSENAINSVQYAPLNANGTIGTWQQTASFTTARYFHGTGVYNGYLYVTGGWGTSRMNDVQSASLNSIPRKATYSKLIDLGVNSKVTNVSYNGTVPAGLRNMKYRMAGSDGVLGSSAVSASPPLACAESIGQYIQISVTLDDSQVGVYRDAIGAANAVLNSITIDSTPVSTPPEKRLRHGAWFSNEQLQPFDTGGTQCS